MTVQVTEHYTEGCFMKKILAILMVLVLAMATLTACGTKDKEDGDNQDTNVGSNDQEDKTGKDDEKPAGDTYEIALITDKGNIDDKSLIRAPGKDSQNLQRQTILHQYYKPEEASDAGYLAQLTLL